MDRPYEGSVLVAMNDEVRMTNDRRMTKLE